MSSLTPSNLLETWEKAESATPATRVLLLLEAAHPERTRAEFEQLRVSARDTLLLGLREELFGTQLRSLTPCPVCGREVELAFETRDLWPATPPNGHGEIFPFRTGSVSGTFRLPISGDWLAVPPDCAAPEEVRDAIALRCLVSLEGGDDRPPSQTLPREALTAIGAAIAERDADAHTELTASCPSCGHLWNALFDIGSFLWREIDAYCQRLLRYVHQLASAYGWSEQEILGLSAQRRETYLALVEQHE
ncbi:MAG TPA: hypothetical protein VNP98_07075 [Chthoniobacterales bacterium]|nr:hypothetical protein [Chthoniobacterales bacterium]